MSETTITANSLVLYKGRPAIVRRAGPKLDIEVQAGSTLNVRPKDVQPLHPGPIQRFDELKAQLGDVLAAWELLAGETVTLRELAELLYQRSTPATAWAAWQLVEDGLYFHGSTSAIRARTRQEVAQEQAERQAKAAREGAWRAFLDRVRRGQFLPEDRSFLNEVEELALGQREQSRVLRELSRAQNPENAHALLLELGLWDPSVNPYPRRLNAPTAGPAISLPGLAPEERADLTHLPAFAIDDEESTDPDDALSFDPANGRLWVHVADVAALVPPGSPADLEARSRGVNLYLPEGTVTMLPPQATQLLGLGLAEVSPALSFGMDLDAEGDIVGVEITPSWVQVTRLTYDEAEMQLAEPPLAAISRLTQLSKARRLAQGAVAIELPEVKIRVVNGQVHIHPLHRLASRALVSEAMILTGEATARFALARNIALPFTVQDPPAEPAAHLPPGLAGMVARRKMLQRSQQSSLPRPHSGLGLEVYARSTSPLRRYLDLVVHQQLRAHLGAVSSLDGQDLLERVGAAEAVSGNMRLAEQLSRQHWTLVFLLQHPHWQGEGIVVDSRNLLATVLVPELGWEARIRMRREAPLNTTLPLFVGDIDLPNLAVHFRVG